MPDKLARHCVPCIKARVEPWRKANRERIKESMRKAARRWYYANTDNVRITAKEKRLKEKYGLTMNDLREMMGAQKNLCSICEQVMCIEGDRLKQNSAQVDHCHKSGVVRSLLCRQCNTMIGTLKEDAKILRKAAEYLESHLDKAA